MSIVRGAADLFRTFAECVCAEDASGAAELFADDGVYDDLLYGEFRGPANIRALLTDHFFRDGGDFRWEVLEAVGDERKAYCHYSFSYTSRHASSLGRRASSSGCARVEAIDGRIIHYREWANTGAISVQLGIPVAATMRMLDRQAQRDIREANPAGPNVAGG
jgi:ketosteroid isomerase-like protein